MRLSEIYAESFDDRRQLSPAYKDVKQKTEDDFTKYIAPYKSIIKKYLDNKKFIYRGMRGTSPLIKANGNKMNRKARNTNNYINLLIDTTIPGWDGFPKRSKSFICSSDLMTAQGYGPVYYVIPLENQSIATAGAEDFWMAFGDSKYGVNKVNNTITTLSWELFKDSTGPNDEDPKQLLADLKKLDDKLSQIDIEDIRYEFNHSAFFIVEEFKEKGIYNCLKEWFTPSNTNMKLFKSFNDYISPKDEEIWLSGKILLAQVQMINEYFGVTT